MKRPKRLPCWIIAGLFFGPVGCTSLQTLDFSALSLKEKFPEATAANPAVNILAIWQAAEGPGPKGVPTRGMAGQIYFFNRTQSAAVRVDGKVRIYLFDDRGPAQEQGKPIHEYDFEPEAWKLHFQVTALGPAYMVFVPYPRPDAYQATCSLRVRFTPKAGPTIYSELSSLQLPGAAPKASPGGLNVNTAQVTPGPINLVANPKLANVSQQQPVSTPPFAAIGPTGTLASSLPTIQKAGDPAVLPAIAGRSRAIALTAAHPDSPSEDADDEDDSPSVSAKHPLRQAVYAEVEAPEERQQPTGGAAPAD